MSDKQQQHTPEPWQIERASAAMSTQQQDYLITYADGELRSHVARLFDNALCAEHGTTEANARRIVACVNACAGMDTETLELAGNGAPNVLEWFRGEGEMHAMKAQRDVLAAALRDLRLRNDGLAKALRDYRGAVREYMRTRTRKAYNAMSEAGERADKALAPLSSTREVPGAVELSARLREARCARAALAKVPK